MRRSLRRTWLVAVALGVGAAVLAAVIGVFGILFVLLIVPGVTVRTWLAATSGTLTGFGGTSLLLLLRPASMGGSGDQGTLFLLLGVLPLVVGLALGGLALATARSPEG
jgi:hypothetical protein